MAGITQTDAETELARSIAARAAILKGEFQVRDRKVKPPTLDELTKDIEYWRGIVREESAKGTRTGRRMRGGTPT